MLRLARTADTRFAYGCAATIFLSAFLLFQVQPVIGKMVLPWFGGSPSVWTTCMLFFQVLLVGGYAYAHFLTKVRSLRWVAGIHGALLLAAALLLPITPAAAWRPPGDADPTWYMLKLLAAHVGLPYFLLATTGPLVQAWFARAYPTRSPYRLYALSNLGSLGALLSYPLLVEPALTTLWQGRIWSGLFVMFAAMCGSLAVVYAGRVRDEPTPKDEPPRPSPCQSRPSRSGSRNEKAPRDVPPSPDVASAPVAAHLRPVDPPSWPSWLHRALWVLLAALASVMLLAVTNHLGQDVAVSPLMWVVPLSLYLLTFIICFDRERWYSRRWYSLLAAIAVLAVSHLQLAPYLDNLYQSYGLEFRIAGFAKRMETVAAAYLTMMFAVCMLCHGELVRLKPLPARLTSFYLSIAVGGAIGGILVGVVCPFVFDNYHELPLAIIVSFLIAASVFALDSFRTWFKERALYKFACLLVAFAGIYVVGWAQAEKMLSGGALARARNFYGVLSVHQHFEDYEPNPEWFGRALYHGRILHGYQYLREDRRRIPTTYFMENSGVGLALRNYPRPADRGLRVSLVGLGAGTLACYGEAGDEYTFYEINPQVVEFAREHFSFLRDCPAEVKTTLGDARLSLEAEVAQQAAPCEVLVLDAFSGDSIPTHLLTREAFQLYEQRLAPDGVICVHVSNRYLNVEPVVVRLAEDAGWSIIAISQENFAGLGEAASDWLIITRNQSFLALPEIHSAKRRPNADPSLPIWTDKYSNLLQIMK